MEGELSRELSARICSLGISFGHESRLYSFPEPHPFNSSRLDRFEASLRHLAQAERTKVWKESSHNVSSERPVSASEDDLLLFHSAEYVELVKHASDKGASLHYLDYGDTPAYNGIYEAALFTVGSTLHGLDEVLKGSRVDHYFNPVGGLHHARRDRAGGFCVFNDCSIAIQRLLDLGFGKVAYVDIDCHHGDGVYYGFESDPRVFIGDIHEDGRYLYPGTGFANETGSGRAKGTKLNIPLPPGSGDAEFVEAFDTVADFISKSNPEFILLQCGADGLAGDPITHMRYTSRAHAYASSRLHDIAHRVCGGRILAMGGGGYDAGNVNDAWSAVIAGLRT